MMIVVAEMPPDSASAPGDALGSGAGAASDSEVAASDGDGDGLAGVAPSTSNVSSMGISCPAMLVRGLSSTTTRTA
jgi:hypothetical protein